MNKEEKIPSILIVDDVQKNIQLLASILSEEGYDIIIAENGQEALDITKEVLPDIILLDIMMPVLDGFETCKRLKESLATKEIPVIFLTAKIETDDIVKGFRTGGVDYVTKPFNKEELLARVNTHLELKLARDARKENLKIISEKNNKLEELNRFKNEFLGMAAHDLRSPLGFIYTCCIMGKDFPQKQADYLEKISKSTDHMLELLNNLLDITAIESGKLNLNMKKQDYIKFLKASIEFNKYLADKKNISLELKTDDNIYGWMIV